jgi:hypothetical protein
MSRVTHYALEAPGPAWHAKGFRKSAILNPYRKPITDAELYTTTLCDCQMSSRIA